MKDPKFGYNWIWMIPAMYLYNLCEFCKQIYHTFHLKMIHKRNPKIKELAKLAGIKK